MTGRGQWFLSRITATHLHFFVVFSSARDGSGSERARSETIHIPLVFFFFFWLGRMGRQGEVKEDWGH